MELKMELNNELLLIGTQKWQQTIVGQTQKEEEK